MPTKKGNPKLLPIKRRLRSNSTRAEELLWAKLRHKQFFTVKFRRQHGIGPYIVDFFCPEKRLVVEVDGDTHATETQQTKNHTREEYLRSLGLQVVRYTNDEVLNNLDGIFEDVSQRLSKESTSPNPSIQRRRKFKDGPSGKTQSRISEVTELVVTKEGTLLDHSSPLPREFYDRPTLKVAKALLGKVLVRETSKGNLLAKIVDVEAYIGPKDKACHASKGRTKRTDIMFGSAGYTYVYLIYGMYHLLNIVTEQEGYPAAILIRGLEPVEKLATSTRQTRIDGPGRVGRFLELAHTLNGLDTTQGRTIWVEDHGITVPRRSIQALPRVGVDYAGEWAKKLWRFCLPTPTPPKKRQSKII